MANQTSNKRMAVCLALTALLIPPVLTARYGMPAAQSVCALEILEIRKAMTEATALLRPGDTLTLESPDFPLARFALYDYFVAPAERSIPTTYLLRLRRDADAGSPAPLGRVLWTGRSPHFFFTLLDRSAP